MFYYSKKSLNKIIHSRACPHIQNVCIDDISSFESLKEAYAKNYRLCRHCSPIAKLYRKDCDKLPAYRQSHAASVLFHDSFIKISTPLSDWKLVPTERDNEVLLYHKNTLPAKQEGPIPGYHLQRISKNTLCDYLEYISEHDTYRNMHPAQARHKKKNSPPPAKGTKRYYKEQRKAAQRARRQSIARVLSLIDELNTQSQVSCTNFGQSKATSCSREDTVL